MQLLNQWQRKSSSEATWEDYTTFVETYPSIELGDKAPLKGEEEFGMEQQTSRQVEGSLDQSNSRKPADKGG